MSNPNKTFKPPNLDSPQAQGRLELALENNEGDMYLDVIVNADGRVELIDPDSGVVILRYNNMAELENFIEKLGLGRGGEEV